MGIENEKKKKMNHWQIKKRVILLIFAKKNEICQLLEKTL